MQIEIVAPNGAPDRMLDPLTYRSAVGAAVDAASNAARRGTRLNPARAGMWLLAEQLTADGAPLARDGRRAADVATRLAALFGAPRPQPEHGADAAISGTPAHANTFILPDLVRGVYAPQTVLDLIPDATPGTPIGVWETEQNQFETFGEVVELGRDGASSGFKPASGKFDSERREVKAFASVVATSVLEDALQLNIPGFRGANAELLTSETQVTHPEALNRYVLGTSGTGGSFYGAINYPGVAKSYTTTATFGTTGQDRVTAFSAVLDAMLVASKTRFRPDTVGISLSLYTQLSRDTYSVNMATSTMREIMARYPDLTFVPVHEFDAIESHGGSAYDGIFLFAARNPMSMRKDVVVVAQPLPVQYREYQQYTYIHTIVASNRCPYAGSAQWHFVRRG